jgi:hypothetical protein
VIDRHRRDKAFVVQVEIKAIDVLGEEHAFVDERPGRERTYVEVEVGFPGSPLDTAAAQIQRPLEEELDDELLLEEELLEDEELELELLLEEDEELDELLEELELEPPLQQVNCCHAVSNAPAPWAIVK